MILEKYVYTMGILYTRGINILFKYTYGINYFSKLVRFLRHSSFIEGAQVHIEGEKREQFCDNIDNLWKLLVKGDPR